MIRRIVLIDEEKCDGCGICAEACHEGAIDIVEGKAKLARENFCDGFGDCLPACPQGAISFEEREAPEYDEEAVKRAQAKRERGNEPVRLSNWPVQIKLAPEEHPYFDGADLLIAADCTAYAYSSIHEDFIEGRVTLVGCPKLDGIYYGEKLTEIISGNDIKSVTLLRMEVPCCGGLEMAAREAVESSGKDIPLRVVTIGIGGRVEE